MNYSSLKEVEQLKYRMNYLKKRLNYKRKNSFKRKSVYFSIKNLYLYRVTKKVYPPIPLPRLRPKSIAEGQILKKILKSFMNWISKATQTKIQF